MTQIYYDPHARYFEHWAVTTLLFDVALTTRFATEAQARASVGLQGGSADPDYDPRRDDDCE